MGLRGTLREASLAEVLQLLALGRKTGVLSLTREGDSGRVHVDRGGVWHAAMVNHRDQLGDRLVRAGLIHANELVALQASLVHEDDRQLMRRLLDQGRVPRDVLMREYRAVVEEVVCQLFTWTSGTFAFTSRLAPDEPPLLTLPADALLLEAARRVDEWTQIEKTVSSLDLLFEVDRGRVAQRGLCLTPEQARIVPWLDGTHDIATIVEASGLGEFAVGKAVYGLVTAGFAQAVGRRVARQHAAPARLVAEHRTQGIDFHDRGMHDEARHESPQGLASRTSDLGARYHLGLIHLHRGAWGEAIRVLRDAAAHPHARPTVLHALAFAFERNGQLDAADVVLTEAVRRGAVTDPRVALSQAIIAIRRGDLSRAEACLANARAWAGAREPAAVWYHHAGLVAAMRGDLDRALALLEEGVSNHPRAVLLYNDLAVVQERRGLHAAAARTLEQAPLAQRSLPHVDKNLGDCYYQAQRYDDALVCYERVVRLAPAHGADVWRKLGDLRDRRGDRAGALLAWQSALAIDAQCAIERRSLAHASGSPVVVPAGTGAADTLRVLPAGTGMVAA
jgi:tetratricopeptide (TPR) repeat protein